MKQDISDVINKIIEEKLGSSVDPLVSSIIKHKVFSLPYYNGFYDDSFILISENNEVRNVKIEFLNNLLSMSNNEKIFDLNRNFKNLNHLYIKEEDIKHFKSLFSSLILSSDIVEYYSEMKNKIESSKDFNDFMSRHIDYFNRSYFNVYLDNFILKNLSKEDSIIYTLQKNDYFYSIKNGVFQEDQELYLDKNISFINNIKSLNEIERLFQNEINICLNELRKNYLYLFEKPNLENISYELFEVQGYTDNDAEYFVSENDSIFKTQILNKHEIERKMLLKSKDSYSLSEELYKYVHLQNNELNNQASDRLYGILYLERDIFNSEDSQNLFLVAKKNDEVISVICFKYNNHKDSLFKSISSSVKHNYRGLGLSTIMYEKLAGLFNDLDLTFINNIYSNEGAERLQRNKNRLNEKYENVFFLETSFEAFKNEKYQLELREFSKSFLEKIDSIDRRNDEITLKSNAIKKLYFKYKEKLILNLNINKEINYDDFLKDLKLDLFQELKVKNKKRNRLKV